MKIRELNAKEAESARAEGRDPVLLPEKYVWKVDLKQRIRDAAEVSTCEEDFFRELTARGVECEKRSATKKQPEYYLYELVDVSGFEGKIPKNLKAKSYKLGENYQPEGIARIFKTRSLRHYLSPHYLDPVGRNIHTGLISYIEQKIRHHSAEMVDADQAEMTDVNPAEKLDADQPETAGTEQTENADTDHVKEAERVLPEMPDQAVPQPSEDEPAVPEPKPKKKRKYYERPFKKSSMEFEPTPREIARVNRSVEINIRHLWIKLSGKRMETLEEQHQEYLDFMAWRDERINDGAQLEDLIVNEGYGRLDFDYKALERQYREFFKLREDARNVESSVEPPKLIIVEEPAADGQQDSVEKHALMRDAYLSPKEVEATQERIKNELLTIRKRRLAMAKEAFMASEDFKEKVAREREAWSQFGLGG